MPETFTFPDPKIRNTLRKQVGELLVERSSPDPEFTAMWDLSVVRGKEMGRIALDHLRRMMVVELCLITRTSNEDKATRNEERWSAIVNFLQPEFGQFDNAQLDKLPELWKSALQDVLKLQDKHGTYKDIYKKPKKAKKT